MKNKIEEICNKLNREQLSVYGATEELLILFSVSQQRELLIAYELDTNKTCTQSMAEAIVDKYLKQLIVA
tara:strand:- start:186 stop:395 length:210 start_codon:yes stop_codon:yes gene_type:complete